MRDYSLRVYNIGQGLFSLFLGTKDDGEPYVAIFDCGTILDYRPNVTNLCIKEAIALIKNNSKKLTNNENSLIIDLIVISHQDIDHWSLLLDIIYMLQFDGKEPKKFQCAGAEKGIFLEKIKLKGRTILKTSRYTSKRKEINELIEFTDISITNSGRFNYISTRAKYKEESYRSFLEEYYISYKLLENKLDFKVKIIIKVDIKTLAKPNNINIDNISLEVEKKGTTIKCIEINISISLIYSTNKENPEDTLLSKIYENLKNYKDDSGIALGEFVIEPVKNSIQESINRTFMCDIKRDESLKITYAKKKSSYEAPKLYISNLFLGGEHEEASYKIFKSKIRIFAENTYEKGSVLYLNDGNIVSYDENSWEDRIMSSDPNSNYNPFIEIFTNKAKYIIIHYIFDIGEEMLTNICDLSLCYVNNKDLIINMLNELNSMTSYDDFTDCFEEHYNFSSSNIDTNKAEFYNLYVILLYIKNLKPSFIESELNIKASDPTFLQPMLILKIKEILNTIIKIDEKIIPKINNLYCVDDLDVITNRLQILKDILENIYHNKHLSIPKFTLFCENYIKYLLQYSNVFKTILLSNINESDKLMRNLYTELELEQIRGVVEKIIECINDFVLETNFSKCENLTREILIDLINNIVVEKIYDLNYIDLSDIVIELLEIACQNNDFLLSYDNFTDYLAIYYKFYNFSNSEGWLRNIYEVLQYIQNSQVPLDTCNLIKTKFVNLVNNGSEVSNGSEVREKLIYNTIKYYVDSFNSNIEIYEELETKIYNLYYEGDKRMYRLEILEEICQDKSFNISEFVDLDDDTEFSIFDFIVKHSNTFKSLLIKEADKIGKSKELCERLKLCNLKEVIKSFIEILENLGIPSKKYSLIKEIFICLTNIYYNQYNTKFAANSIRQKLYLNYLKSINGFTEIEDKTGTWWNNYQEDNFKKNLTSLITRFQIKIMPNKQIDILFPGDATYHVFSYLANSALMQDAIISLLIAPHHGSYDTNFLLDENNTPVEDLEQPLYKLLSKYPPEVVFISSYFPKYGHPFKYFINKVSKYGWRQMTNVKNHPIYCTKLDEEEKEGLCDTDKAIYSTQSWFELTNPNPQELSSPEGLSLLYPLSSKEINSGGDETSELKDLEEHPQEFDFCHVGLGFKASIQNLN